MKSRGTPSASRKRGIDWLLKLEPSTDGGSRYECTNQFPYYSFSSVRDLSLSNSMSIHFLEQGGGVVERFNHRRLPVSYDD